MPDARERHVREIDRCNQRGGRMLSIVDLIRAGTFTGELAAWSLAAIRGGASFMVGARPGGAGKTTVMGALLNFVPEDVELIAADGMATIGPGLTTPHPRRCYVCHEIGRGSYYAYLWGEPLRLYFELPRSGHMLATNLHADTYEESRSQVCDGNGISTEAFRRMSLLFFLSVSHGMLRSRRVVVTAWESDGRSDHRQVFGDGVTPGPAERSRLVKPSDQKRAEIDIQRLLGSGKQTIEDVRDLLVGL